MSNSLPEPSNHNRRQTSYQSPAQPSYPLLGMALLTCLAVLTGNHALAINETATPPATNAPPPAKTLPEKIDRLHDRLSGSVLRSASYIDCLFAGRQKEVSETSSWIRIVPRLELADRRGLSAGAAFRGTLRLPHLKERFELIADNIPHTLLPGQDVPPTDYKNDVNTALRFKIWRAALSAIDLDCGMNFNPWPAPFSRLTLSHTFDLEDNWALTMEQQGFLYVRDDGFGEITQLELTRIFQTDCGMGWLAAATWSEESVGVEWENTLRFWRTLPRQALLEARASVFGHVDANSIVDNYRLNCTYRQNVWRPWLFFSITPQVAFPNEYDFQPTPLLRFCLEIVCGDCSKVNGARRRARRGHGIPLGLFDGQQQV